MLEALNVLAKLTLAVIFGGAVGWQRETRDRPAGLRTHVLVCVGSAVYTLASLSFTGPTADPGRVAAQVATGMGFLGAGTIIRHGNVVRGLTTAASMWTVAAIGLCVGIGGEGFLVATLATVVVLLTLTVLRRAEQRLLARARLGRVTLRLTGGPGRVREVKKLLEGRGTEVESLEVSQIGPGGVQEIQLRMALHGSCEVEDLEPELTQLEGFVSMRCE